ncbi:MAG: cupin domain-containing protein [Rikenellaceae bacterium]
MIKCSLGRLPITLTSHGVGEKRVLLNNSDTQTHITQIAITTLNRGEVADLHAHPTMEEYFIIRKGGAEIIVDSEVFVCELDDFIQIPPHSPHQLKAVTDLEILTIGCATE